MSVGISSAALQQIMADCRASPGVETCGLLFGGEGRIDRAERCENVAVDPAQTFEIDPRALIAAYRGMRMGGPTLVGYYHSHPNGSVEPSRRDADAAPADGMLWLIAAQGGIALWRAVDGGERHGRFDAVEHHVEASPCAPGDASPEGARPQDVAGEACR